MINVLKGMKDRYSDDVQKYDLIVDTAKNGLKIWIWANYNAYFGRNWAFCDVVLGMKQMLFQRKCTNL